MKDDVRWIGGALWMSAGYGGLLIDAPAGVHEALDREGLLPSLQAVLVSSARTRPISGLLPLWDALGINQRRTLRVLHVLGDERTPLLAQAWAQGWPEGIRLDLDGMAPGTCFDVAGIDVELVPLRIGEPVSGGTGGQGVAGCGLRLHTGARTISWLPCSRPGTAAARLCSGVDLAVIEIAATRWPKTEVPWRMSRNDALQAAMGASASWLVGDDGTKVDEDLQ